ncbi:MAG: hypothetical protein P8Y80_05410, partial [Acidobacteriota bacterium]
VPISIGLVTSEDLVSPSCGSVVEDLAKIPPAPALHYDENQIRVRGGGAEAGLLINGMKIRTSDGVEQPASQPVCFDNTEVLKQTVEVLYEGNVVATFNLSQRLKVTELDKHARYGDNFYSSPSLLPGQVQVIHGPFDGQGPGTSVDVGGKPGRILAETSQSLYWLLPADGGYGSISVTVRDAGRGATFPVYVLGLAMSADRLKLLRGESTAMQAKVFGPELMPAEAWRAGDVSDVVDMANVAKKFPDFKVPKPGGPGVIFFRLDNISRNTVSMKPSKNESFVVKLDRGSFSSGPYTYEGKIQSKKAGGFQIDGLVIAFFEPIPGNPLPPQDPEIEQPGTPVTPASPGQ